MNTNSRLILVAAFILIVIPACNAVPLSGSTPTLSITSTPTPLPTSTLTLTPPPRPTSAPTPIGGSEPQLAFIGANAQGKLGVYIDGLYTGMPVEVSPVNIPVENASRLLVKWSPDGSRLLFINTNAFRQKSFFVFDRGTRQTKEIQRVPNGLDIVASSWSADGHLFYFGAASRSHPQIVNYKLDLVNRMVSQAHEFTYINNNSHANSGADCSGQFPPAIRALTIAASGGLAPTGAVYDRICYYPAVGTYAGLKYDQTITEFVLLSQMGKPIRTLAVFPAKFMLNGFLDLRVSPDKSRVLIIGEGGDVAPLRQFVIPLRLANVLLDESRFKSGTFLAPIHAFGWSPDSLDYLVAEYGGRLEVMRARDGAIVYEYSIRNPIAPLVEIGQSASGFDMIWLAAP